jgi:DNA-binding transcriptional ArsR family regulator
MYSWWGHGCHGIEMGRSKLNPDLLRLVAERFKALSEPARLDILNALRAGEMTVSELVEETGLGQANLSKHIQMLLAHNFVSRRKEGLFSYYAIADRDVFRLCDLVCGRLASEVAVRRKVVVAR